MKDTNKLDKSYNKSTTKQKEWLHRNVTRVTLQNLNNDQRFARQTHISEQKQCSAICSQVFFTE